MRSIHANGIRFFYEDVGDGPSMLLLGKTLGTADADFAPQIEAFGRTFRVIAPERRGYGRSRPPDRDFPDDFYQRDADDMAALMTALGLPSASLLGWSEGADVALCLARSYPEQVARLVVWGGVAAIRDADIAVFEASRETAAWPSKARQAMTAIYGDTYWRATYSDWCDVMLRLHARGGDAMIGPIERIACPTLIVHGSKDAFIDDVHPASLHARIPDSGLHVIESGGHGIHLSHTREFNRVVSEFLSAPRDAGQASTASPSD